jgi:hypothetical protein
MGVTALGMAAVGYVGGKEGLKPIPISLESGSAVTARPGECPRACDLPKGQCESMLNDGLVNHETGMRKCLKYPDAIPDKSYLAFLLRSAPSNRKRYDHGPGQGQQGRHRRGEAMEANGNGSTGGCRNRRNGFRR